MTYRSSVLLTLMLTAGFCLAQTTAPQSAPNATAPQSAPAAKSQSSSGGGVIPVELEKSLDSKKLKQGDEVDAKTLMDLHTGNGVTIPKGTKVVGEVTQATARSKGDSDSSLGMTFSKIEMKNGQSIPLKASLQAIGPPPGSMMAATPDTGMTPSPASPPNTGMSPQTNSSGGSATTPSPVNGNAPPPDQSMPQGNTGQMNSPSGHLTGRSVGVVGISGLELRQDSVLTAKGKSVKLDGGSQMLLKVQNQ